MHCQSCQKLQATVTVVEPVYHDEGGNGRSPEIRKLNLCAPCAKAAGVPFAGAVLTQSQIVSQLGKFLLKPVHEIAPAGKDVTCPDCGWSLRDFRQTSRFGCPRDYEVFGEFVNELLQRIHGASEHPSSKAEADLAKFHKELNEAIGKEDYESAAKIRDEIRNLELSMEKTGESD